MSHQKIDSAVFREEKTARLNVLNKTLICAMEATIFFCCKELVGKGFERSTEGDKKHWLKTSLLILILAQQLGQILKQDHKTLF